MPESLKALWQKIIKQAGSVHLLAAVVLLVLALSLLAPDQQNSEFKVQEHSVQEAAAQEPDPGVEDSDDAVLSASETTSPDTSEPAPDTAVTLSESAIAPADSASNSETLLNPHVITEAEARVESAVNLVLIIDDIGYNAEAGRRAINLPGQITYAVIPYTPHGKVLAESAHQADKEVMLHAPMSNLSGMDLGQGGLTLLLNEEEFMQTLQSALADIPHIKGVNNHTGSELTAVAQPMQWLMQELKHRGLYFVDSVTTNASVAAATAEQYQVPSLRRHVFLDNVQTAQAIDWEFKRALALAKTQGFAVAIGHPYPETLTYLESALPLLAAQNIQLVSASSMIAQLRKPEPVETTAAW